MTERQLAAAMADLAEMGWVILDDFEDACQVYRAVILAGVPADQVNLQTVQGGRVRIEVSGRWIAEQLARAQEPELVAAAGSVRLCLGGRRRLLTEVELGRAQVLRLLGQVLVRGRARLAALLDPAEVRQALVRHALAVPAGDGGGPDARAQGA